MGHFSLYTEASLRRKLMGSTRESWLPKGGGALAERHISFSHSHSFRPALALRVCVGWQMSTGAGLPSCHRALSQRIPPPQSAPFLRVKKKQLTETPPGGGGEKCLPLPTAEVSGITFLPLKFHFFKNLTNVGARSRESNCGIVIHSYVSKT